MSAPTEGQLIPPHLRAYLDGEPAPGASHCRKGGLWGEWIVGALIVAFWFTVLGLLIALAVLNVR